MGSTEAIEDFAPTPQPPHTDTIYPAGAPDMGDEKNIMRADTMSEDLEDQKQGAPKLKRSLKSRHMGMIAIGGTIGTGLFIGSGTTIAEAGPAGALVAYAVMGSMVFFVCTSLGE
ncbi:hypothetical protein EC988_009783, partial [Linderina pennispora]